MKVLVLFSVLFVTIFILLQHVSSISTLDKETCDLLVQVIKGEFTVPVKSRTVPQKSALVRFWRNREKLPLRGAILCYDGKSVVKKEGVSDVVKKIYKSLKGSGVRKICHKLKYNYSGVAERDVQKVLAKSSVHQRLNVRFENKESFRPVRARTVHIRHQIDLVDMKRLRTRYKGKTCRYVLSIIDVFSRYHWLVPLQTKKSSQVARELLRIYTEHGAPCVIQHDQGREFEGAVAALCKKLGIKIVKGRPYHPQSQGKVERARPPGHGKGGCELDQVTSRLR
ncbi:SCAN domain-containing protein 3-like [Orbicella faveolata]|uniref:SCAN domain-containing protein 3-like n=1 Tax=Orbicella faveolata TaxID=48498 RepID=UPI0009E445FD|nr:SCAN domain-containing protein 3-like [Orbicella faveolata]